MTFNIYGCCVSREPVEALIKKRGDIKVNQYVAFINPVSLCSPKNTNPISIDDLNDLPTSGFRKRNLCLDVNGTAFDYLFSKESDYIIVDTWDFRQPMIEKNNCYITIDPTTIKRNNEINTKFGWSEHQHIFYNEINPNQLRIAIDELSRRILEHYKPEQIILMNSYAIPNYYAQEQKKIIFYKRSDLDALDELNLRAKENFERLRSNFGNCHVVDFPRSNTVYGASDAKWGIMFLHYWDLYYEYAADAIDIILHNLPRSEEIDCLLKLKKQYEINADIKTQDAIVVSSSNEEKVIRTDLEDIAKMNSTVIIDKMLNTRDVQVYFECLQCLKEKLLIVISTRHTPGNNIPNSVVENIHALGFTDFTKQSLRMYTGIVSLGKEVFDKSADKSMEPVEFNGTVDGVKLSVISRSWTGGLLSRIEIDGEDYSLNERGINIVVYDIESRKVIDSINYDAYTSSPTFYHKNLAFNKEYFNTHFFVRDGYEEIWAAPYKKKYFTERSLDTRNIENGIILPNKIIGNAVYGGVCTEKLEFVSGYTTIMPDINSKSRHIVGSYKFSDNELKYVDEVVVYGGTLMDHPGHLLCEGFTDRIWWFLKNPDIKAKVAVVCIWGDGSCRFQREFLNQFGFKNDEIIFVDRPTKFKKVIVPDQSEHLFKTSTLVPYEFTKESVSVIQRLIDNAPKSSHKKVYFTKTKTEKSNIVGEDFFIDFFAHKGFEIINPEDHTLEEKISILHDAEEFVSLFGTNTCYAVFCKPDVKLTILSRNCGFLMETQAMFNEAVGIKECYCVDTSLNFFGANLTFGLTFVGVTECFKRYVMEIYHEELNVTPQDFMNKYLYIYMKKFPEYYSNPRYFDFIKNQNMLTVLQNMNEVFNGKSFDTSKLDLTTNEDKLNNQVKQLTADLNASKSQITELKNTDVYKTAKLLEVTNSKLEKQIAELHETLSNTQILQSKIDKMTDEKADLEKKLLQEAHEREKMISRQEDLQEKVIQLQLSEENLNNQIAAYEKSGSWRITKPLRSIAWFFHKLFGKSK